MTTLSLPDKQAQPEQVTTNSKPGKKPKFGSSMTTPNVANALYAKWIKQQTLLNVHLITSGSISGTLSAASQYTLHINEAGTKEEVLIFKHGIVMIRPQQEDRS